MTRRLADLVLSRPRVVLLIGTVLAIAGAVAGVLGVRFDADTDSLISADRPFMMDYESFKARFGDLERIWVVVDAGDNEAAGARVVDWLEPRLQALDLPQVAARITAAEQARLVSWAAPPDEVEAIAGACSLLAKAKDGPDALLHAAAQDLQDTDATFSDYVAHRRKLVGAAVTAITVFVGEGGPCQDTVGKDRYLTSPSGRLSFIGILPEKDYSTLAVIEAPLASIRAVLSKARDAFPDVDIGLTGKPVIQADEMRVTQDDMQLAAIVAIVLVSALVMLILREVKRPLLTIIVVEHRLPAGHDWCWARLWRARCVSSRCAAWHELTRKDHVHLVEDHDSVQHGGSVDIGGGVPCGADNELPRFARTGHHRCSGHCAERAGNEYGAAGAFGCL